jgi:dTDP-4-dehydrorhamnose 3,5-epimerase
MQLELEIESLRLSGIKLLRTRIHADRRGTFSELYSRRTFAAAGLSLDFVQDNYSVSTAAGTVRGLHYQAPPWAQGKLIRVLRGRIFDVAVDLRKSSPTFLNWISIELSADDGSQLLIPVGFAHGFCTLEPDTHVLYKVTNFYAPAHDCGIRWNDPDLAIEWPVSEDRAIVSEKDVMLPIARDVERWF